MFWNKKDMKVSDWGKPFYRDENGEWNGLATTKKVNELIERIELLENHLNLKYIPEMKKKEPAKLVEKVDVLTAWGLADTSDYSMGLCLQKIAKNTASNYIKNKKEPKKRGRPKKK